MNPKVLVTLACSLLLSWSSVAAHAAPRRDSAKTDSRAMTIAVADFAGADKELGRFLAETLLTSLAKSSKLNLVERTEIRQALSEMKLQSTGLFQPQEVKQLGKLVSADRLIVGSYLIRDEQLIVNARLLDVRTGKLAPSGAANVSGLRTNILEISQRLAAQFHKRVTGEALEGETGDEAQPQVEPERDPTPPIEVKPRNRTETATFAPEWKPLVEKGLVPKTAKANDVVAEKELALVVTRAAKLISAQKVQAVAIAQPMAPVSRIRALTALIRLVVSPDTITLYRESPPQLQVPDLKQTPPWGVPYVHAALQEGWWREENALQPRQNATWGFVCQIMLHLPFALQIEQEAEPTQLASTRMVETEDSNACSGLIVEAYDFKIERTMSPRILDEDGRVVYPDPKFLPDYDYLQDNGMAAYHVSVREAKRAGKRPLVVKAIDVVGPVGGDLVVSNRTAERIRAANRGGRFLSRWAVCILTSN